MRGYYAILDVTPELLGDREQLVARARAAARGAPLLPAAARQGGGAARAGRGARARCWPLCRDGGRPVLRQRPHGRRAGRRRRRRPPGPGRPAAGRRAARARRRRPPGLVIGFSTHNLAQAARRGRRRRRLHRLRPDLRDGQQAEPGSDGGRRDAGRGLPRRRGSRRRHRRHQAGRRPRRRRSGRRRRRADRRRRRRARSVSRRPRRRRRVRRWRAPGAQALPRCSRQTAPRRGATSSCRRTWAAWRSS